MARKERGLGRGLDALIPADINMEEENAEVKEISVKIIDVRTGQPRKSFDEESLQELAKSIKDHGIIQPVLVRPKEERYEIIAGERRYRAAILAKLENIPAIVKEIDEVEADELSLIENLQRENLNVIEEAAAYKNMINRYGYTQEHLAKRIGKSRSHITNTIRILGLPEEIRKMIEKGRITAGHARSILGLNNQKDQINIAREIAKGKLSVRETEKRVKDRNEKTKNTKTKNLETMDLEEKLQRILGTRVEFVEKDQGGKIEVYYYSNEDLERLLEIIGL